MTEPDKVRENRIRRMAQRQGFQVEKSHRRDPRAWDFGTYQVVDPYTNTIVASADPIGRGYGLTLDALEEWLSGGNKDA